MRIEEVRRSRNLSKLFHVCATSSGRVDYYKEHGGNPEAELEIWDVAKERILKLVGGK